MNNALISPEEETPDRRPMLRERARLLEQVVESLRAVRGSSHWKVLEAQVFGPEMQGLYRKLKNEKNPTEFYRLQGRIDEMERFSLDELLQAKERELGGIRSHINGDTA